MIIEQSVLHIFDFLTENNIFSDNPIDLSDPSIYDFIAKHIKNTINSTNAEQGIVSRDSTFAIMYSERVDFIDFSKRIANEILRLLSMSNSRNSFDLLLTKYNDNDVDYISFIFLKHKPSFTRMVETNELGISNQIIKHSSIFVSSNQKVDNFAIVNMSDFTVRFLEEKIDINAEPSPLFSKNLFSCVKTTKPTKEILKKVDKIVEEVALAYEVNPVVALTNAKNYVNEKLESNEEIITDKLSEDIFPESLEMQEKFTSLAKEKEIPVKIEVDKKVASKVIKNQKIKTDTGIEVIFPAEYSQNHDFIEFINNPDGTISIQIKNIAKISNK